MNEKTNRVRLIEKIYPFANIFWVNKDVKT